MNAPRFLTGRCPSGLLWAAIDANVNYLQPRIAESRFAAYLAPYRSEEAARAALIEACADPDSISAEERKRARRGR